MKNFIYLPLLFMLLFTACEPKEEDKETKKDYKGFLFFETNNTNPLNALSFVLDDEEETPVWDVVTLFASNINMKDGKPYFNHNDNVKFYMDNHADYIKPLQDKGIKVLVGLLGNHDEAGLAQLSEKGCRHFAREIAQVCKDYKLDGVNFDDEYSKAPDLDNEYLAARTKENAARLMLYTRQEFDKLGLTEALVTVFDYGLMYGASSVDGVDAKDFVDIVVADYGRISSPVGGMSKEQCSGASLEFANGRGGKFNGNNFINSGCGWYMGFAIAPKNFDSAVERLNNDTLGMEVVLGAPVKKPTIYYNHKNNVPLAIN